MCIFMHVCSCLLTYMCVGVFFVCVCVLHEDVHCMLTRYFGCLVMDHFNTVKILVVGARERGGGEVEIPKDSKIRSMRISR